MKGMRTLFQLRGIPIRVHFTLGLAFLFLIFQWGAWGLPGGVILFASVLAHELGHAAVAQKLGISISSIDLHLLGGTANMGEHPEEPADEIMIAAAGPLVSLGLAVFAGVLAWALNPGFVLNLGTVSGVFAFTAAVNLMLGAFNLIPALPMDGGRILRGFLARKMSAVRATKIAGRFARIIALGLGVWGIGSANFSLTLIAVFVYFLSKREEHMANLRESSLRWAQNWESKMDPKMNGYIIDVTSKY